MFIALWRGKQYGCLNGNVAWLRETAVSRDMSVFHDYQHPQQSQQGYTGQALWIDVDQLASQVMPGAPCNRPTYCIAPNEAGELAYVAGILTPETNRAYGGAYLRAMLADSRLGAILSPQY